MNDRGAPPIMRATALTLMSPAAGPAVMAAIDSAISDADPLVRRAVAERLGALDVQTRLRLGQRLLSDPVRTVRLEAVSAMVGVPAPLMSGDIQKSLDAAIAEYRGVQQFNVDRADANINLGALEAALGHASAAETAYRRAMRLQPQFVPAYVNLADVLRGQNREAEAERVLRDGTPAAT